MSLINEALKKAQRQRTDAPGGELDGAGPGGRPIQKRTAPMRAQTMILIAAAGITLVVCSVVVTVYLLTRKPVEPAKALAATPKLPAVDLNAPSPVIVAPVVVAPPPTTPPAAAKVVTPVPAPPATVAVASSPKSLPQKTAVASASATAASSPSPAPAVAAPASAPKPAVPPDPRVLQFVDAIKVTGIRSSGTDSKVLMNDRVFRVNEIVERTLEVKLVKVASDALTFEDANGVIYTKTF